MKALMFGWEFPPHILGGLGTASYGLTKGMSECGNMDITFVIPKPWGDEDKSFAQIIKMHIIEICINMIPQIKIFLRIHISS